MDLWPYSCVSSIVQSHVHQICVCTVTLFHRTMNMVHVCSGWHIRWQDNHMSKHCSLGLKMHMYMSNCLSLVTSHQWDGVPFPRQAPMSIVSVGGDLLGIGSTSCARYSWEHPGTTQVIFNPRRACAARVTVVVLCVCLSVRRLFWQYVQSQVKPKIQ